MSRALRLAVAAYVRAGDGAKAFAEAIEDLSITGVAVKPAEHIRGAYYVGWLCGRCTTLVAQSGETAGRSVRALDTWYKKQGGKTFLDLRD